MFSSIITLLFSIREVISSYPAIECEGLRIDIVVCRQTFLENIIHREPSIAFY